MFLLITSFTPHGPLRGRPDKGDPVGKRQELGWVPGLLGPEPGCAACLLGDCGKALSLSRPLLALL